MFNANPNPVPPVIRFTISPCSLGFVMIAVADRAIRSILVGDDPEMLMSELQIGHPNDTLEVDRNYDAQMTRKIIASIERPEQEPGLTLDVHGTGFEVRVWDALRKVPPGTTANYTFLAEQRPEVLHVSTCNL